MDSIPSTSQQLEFVEYDSEEDLSEEEDVSDENSFDKTTQEGTLSVDSGSNRLRANRFLSGNMTFKEYTATVEPKHSTRKQKKTDVDIIIRSSQKNLPASLRGLLGEANLCLARRNHDEALKLCLEVIREMPTAPAPFHTLAEIYEEKGQLDKRLQFALIAAHLSPGCSEQWVSLAEACLQQKDVPQAISCYSKAIKYDKYNKNLYLMKAKLLEESNNTRGLYKTYHRMVEILKPEHGLAILEYAKKTATYYHQNIPDQGILKAKEIMEIAFKRVPEFVTPEDVNLMVELFISTKEYVKALECISLHCDVKVEAEEDVFAEDDGSETSSLRVLSVLIPDDIQIEIRVKLTVLLIHMLAFHLLPQLLSYFEASEQVESYGDLFIDIVEALMAQNQHSYALNLLNMLVNSKNFSLAAVWLNFAECLHINGQTEDAVGAYLTVTKLAPQHVQAKLRVSEILNNLGRTDEAITVLTQDPSYELMASQLLYEKCLLLKDKIDRTDEFIGFTRLLMSRHCLLIRSSEVLDTLSKLRVFSYKQELVRKMQDVGSERKTDFIESSVSPNVTEEWQLFKHLCLELNKKKDFPLLQRVVFSALGSAKFNALSTPTTIKEELLTIALFSCFFNKDEAHGYHFARNLVIVTPNLPSTWNIFNLITHNSSDLLRHGKFIIRQLTSKPNHLELTLIHANNCLMSRSFKYAFSDYVSCFHKDPTNAYIALMIGITLLMMAGSRTNMNKNSPITQALAYFQLYKELRGEDMEQEIYYNLGRMYHQLGLLHVAMTQYKKALQCRNELIVNYPEMLDLKCEIAFNMSLIYQASGSYDLARALIEQYIVIE